VTGPTTNRVKGIKYVRGYELPLSSIPGKVFVFEKKSIHFLSRGQTKDKKSFDKKKV